MSLFIGLISGTSMDGIDAALINADTNTLLHGITMPYPDHIKNQLVAFDAAQSIPPKALLQLHSLLGQTFATAALELIQQTEYNLTDIEAIGSHGQTLYHAPDDDIPTTLQIACPHTIATKTNKTVVADFRTRDLALGGQGAPFAPYYHQVIFKNNDLPLAVVNIGGISNLTILSKDAPPLGYDTGPGNVLMDLWVKRNQNKTYDKNGAWAKTGEVSTELLDKLLADPFCKMQPPKSIDKGYYSKAWLSNHLKKSYKAEDVQATLLHFTAHTIADAFKNSAPFCKQLVLCGGGAHNQYLQEVLQQYLPETHITTTQTLGVSPDYLEAMMFAWFAQQTLNHHALDLTQITGARQPAVLGAIYL